MPGADDRPGPRSVLEPVEALPGAFDAGSLARGAPGVPRRFVWRGRTYEVEAVLGDDRAAGGVRRTNVEGYVRAHAFRVRTTTGEVMLLSGARGPSRGAERWVLRSVEGPPAPPEGATERADDGPR